MTRRVAMLIYPDIQNLDAIGPLEILAAARDTQGRAAYQVEIAGPAMGPVKGSSGLSLVATRAWADVDPGPDTLLIAGGYGSRMAAQDPVLVGEVRRLAASARRYGSVCTGAFILGAAGLLDGKRVATHWAYAEMLAHHYPQALVDAEPIHVRDGALITSAGVTAGQDLALSLVEEDLGFDAAMALARQFVMFLRRPGGQAQFSSRLAAQMAARGPLAEVIAWIHDHLDQDLSVPRLAELAHMSARNFQRRFTHDMGLPPAALVARARVEAARELLETSGLPLDQIARKTGHASADHLRRALTRQVGVAPRAYRSRFQQPKEMARHDSIV